MSSRQVSSSQVKAGPVLPTAMNLVARLRGYSWGALFGLAVTGALTLALPTIHQKPWLELPLGMLCVGGGILIERVVRYFLGPEIDSWVRHLSARREAQRELEKLREYQKRHLVPEAEARRIALRISRRDIRGGAQPGNPRGPYRKRSPAPAPPYPSPAPEPPKNAAA